MKARTMFMSLTGTQALPIRLARPLVLLKTVARDRATDSDCNGTPRERLMKKAKKVKKAKKAQKMDLGAIFDAHIRHEFVDHDVAATMKTMAAEPYVHNVPTLTGGDGYASVVDFYTHHFVGKMPADTRIERISRTVGRDQVVDELIIYFTHDC